MFILHDSANYLASKGVDVNFKLPSISQPSMSLSATVAHTHIDSLASVFNSAVSKVKEAKSQEHKRFAERQEKASNELLNLMHKYIREVFVD